MGVKHGLLTRILKKRIDAMEMWFYTSREDRRLHIIFDRRMNKTSWKDKVKNEKALDLPQFLHLQAAEE